MAPREGSSIAPHGGVLDERLNVHGVKGLKVCDLSICPDNVGCNTFSVSFFSISMSHLSLTWMPPTDCSLDRREVCYACCGGFGLLGGRAEDGCSDIPGSGGIRQLGSPMILC